MKNKKSPKQLQESIEKVDCEAVFSNIYSDFNKMRECVIGSRLPLKPLVADKRFLHRIRQDSDEFNEYLKLINEEIKDPADRDVIKNFFNTQIQQDWSIVTCPTRFEIYEKIEPIDPDAIDEAIDEAFELMGVLCWKYCYDNEESLYGISGGGQKWIEDFFESAVIKPSQLKQYVLWTEYECLEIGIYKNVAGILTAGPKIGSKFLNYEIVAMEICDFLNRCFYPSHLVLYISERSYAGTFVLVEIKTLDQFLQKLENFIKK